MGPVVVCRTTLVPDPDCVFGLSSSSALVAKTSRVIWSGKVYFTGDVLLLESKELGGEDMDPSAGRLNLHEPDYASGMPSRPASTAR